MPSLPRLPSAPLLPLQPHLPQLLADEGAGVMQHRRGAGLRRIHVRLQRIQRLLPQPWQSACAGVWVAG